MKLADWRKEIDVIDAEIASLIWKRAEIVKKIGVLKAYAGLPILNSEREEEVLRNISISGNPKEKELIINVFKQIIRESRKIQVAAVKATLKNGERIYR